LAACPKMAFIVFVGANRLALQVNWQKQDLELTNKQLDEYLEVSKAIVISPRLSLLAHSLLAEVSE